MEELAALLNRTIEIPMTLRGDVKSEVVVFVTGNINVEEARLEALEG